MHLLIIDAMNLIRRMYAAMADHENKEQACAHRCVSAIADMVGKLEASHCTVVFEEKELTWRHQLWPDYKKGRSPMPKSLQSNLHLFKEAFVEAGYLPFKFQSWEADDVIASLACKAAYHGLPVTVVSTDKGFFQIADERIQILNYFDRKLYSLQDIEQRYGVAIDQLIDLWGLTGDTTNHLPGVSGIGIKTATQLLQQFGDLDNLLIQKQQAGLSDKLSKALDEQWQSALLTRKLIKLVQNLPLGINLHQMRIKKSS